MLINSMEAGDLFMQVNFFASQRFSWVRGMFPCVIESLSTLRLTVSKVYPTSNKAFECPTLHIEHLYEILFQTSRNIGYKLAANELRSVRLSLSSLRLTGLVA
jgi:hypothetical protein